MKARAPSARAMGQPGVGATDRELQRKHPHKATVGDCRLLFPAFLAQSEHIRKDPSSSRYDMWPPPVADVRDDEQTPPLVASNNDDDPPRAI